VLRLGDTFFTRGRSRFRDHSPQLLESTAKVYVRVRILGYPDELLAQLDTGAAWSVLSPDVAEALGVLDSSEPPVIQLQTRFGRHTGALVRIPISLVADEGESCEKEAVFFVSPDWPPGQSFLGYSGLLDSIRFALDPQANDFYFGLG
jgi:hypothetical protein